MDLRPGASIERYTLLDLVGRGGMAAVWRARHKQLGTIHAIKVLEIQRDTVRSRLLQEGRIQATLAHPNVVAVTDVVEVGGSPALVLEWVDGFPLDRLLAHRRLTPGQVDDLMWSVFEGLIEVERRGLIHRDLKPANILIAVKPGRIIPKVADFGVAKVLAGEDGRGPTTRSGIAMGTPSYMAVEQFRDAKDVDVRADVFSLGAIFYELSTGQRAFPSDDLVKLVYQIAEERYEPLTNIAPELPDARREVIERALRADRTHRFDNIGAMRDAWYPQGKPPEADWTEILAMTDQLRPVPSEAPADPNTSATWDAQPVEASSPKTIPTQRSGGSEETIHLGDSDPEPLTAPSRRLPLLVVFFSALFVGFLGVALGVAVFPERVKALFSPKTDGPVVDEATLTVARVARDQLEAALSTRTTPLLLGLAALHPVGINPDSARAVDLQLDARLQGLPNLRVFRLKGSFASDAPEAVVAAGNEAGVDHVIVGSIAEVGGRTTLVAELVDVAKGSPVAQAFREGRNVDEVASLVDVVLLDLLVKATHGATPEQTEAVVAQSVALLEPCIEAAKKRKVGGQVVLAWTVRRSGRVADVHLEEGSARDKVLEKCLVDGASAWVLPPDLAGPMKWPFNLGPASPRMAAQPKPSAAAAPDPQSSTLQSLVKARQGSLLACMGPLLGNGQPITTDVWLIWTIDPDGSTSAVTVGEGTLKDPEVRACVGKAVDDWTFPTGGISGPVTYQLTVQLQ